VVLYQKIYDWDTIDIAFHLCNESISPNIFSIIIQDLQSLLPLDGDISQPNFISPVKVLLIVLSYLINDDILSVRAPLSSNGR